MDNRSRNLNTALALFFLVSMLVAGLVVLTAENGPLGPQDPLKNYIRYVDGKLQLLGGMPQELWKQAVERIFNPPGQFDPYSHWQISTRGNYGTASWVYFDAKLPSWGSAPAPDPNAFARG